MSLSNWVRANSGFGEWVSRSPARSRFGIVPFSTLSLCLSVCLSVYLSLCTSLYPCLVLVMTWCAQGEVVKADGKPGLPRRFPLCEVPPWRAYSRYRYNRFFRAHLGYEAVGQCFGTTQYIFSTECILIYFFIPACPLLSLVHHLLSDDTHKKKSQRLAVGDEYTSVVIFLGVWFW